MKINSFMMAIPQFFDVGISSKTGEKLKELGCTKVLVMYDKGVEAAGITQKVIEVIQAEGITVVTSNKVEADPTDLLITEIGDFAKAEKVDGVVAIGGGSSIDAAKGVKLLLNNDEPIEKFYDLTVQQKIGIPMIAIPTTSGTGSEASKGSVITDNGTGRKRVVIGMGTMPDMALIDPELVLGVPSKVTAACAFDVLAHAIDAITSNMTNAITQSISYEAIRLMKNSYKEVCENGSDLEARTEMHLAANLGGIALANAKCSISHAFAHSMGAVYHIPHGVCCAIFTPACLEFVAEACPKEIIKIADLLDIIHEKSDSVAEIAKKTSEKIHEMYRSVGISDITEFVPNVQDAYEKIIPLAFEDIMANFSPRKMDDSGAKWIIDRTYELADEKSNK